MKKSLSCLTALLLTFVSVSAQAEEIVVYKTVDVNYEEVYKQALATCDEIYAEETAAAKTNSEALDSTISVIGCYEKIGLNVIDRFYSKNSLDQKIKFKNYINAADELTNGIYETQDYCTPECGSLSTLEAKAAAADMIKFIIEEYIVAASRS